MISFDELKSRALDLTQSGVAKAKELTDVAKLNIANSTEEDNIRKAYIELGKLYYADVRAAGFTVDETIDDQTASGGRYAVRAFNSGGAMFEMVCQGGNMGIYIGEKYS